MAFSKIHPVHMEVSTLKNLAFSLKRLAQEAYANQPKVLRRLVLQILGLMIAVLLIDYALLRWYAWFMDEALLKLNVSNFIKGVILYLIILVLTAFFEGYRNYYKDQLALRWRNILQNSLLDQYLSFQSFYWLNNENTLDHPEQRLTDDIRESTQKAVELVFGLLEALFQFIIYAAVVISGSWMLFVLSLLYAWWGNKFSLFLGKKLVLRQEIQQQLEAQVRLDLSLVAQNAESIALLNNGDRIISNIQLHVEQMLRNFALLIGTKKNLKIADSVFNNIGIIFPYLIVSPFYFSGQMSFGALGMLSNAFFKIKTTFSYGISHFYEISELNACINRLSEIQNFCITHKLRQKKKDHVSPERLLQTSLSAQNIYLRYGSKFLNKSPINFTLSPGKIIALKGPNGAGKSTLIRCLAGLHNDYDGNISVPIGLYYYIPSVPYFYFDPILTDSKNAIWIEMLSLQTTVTKLSKSSVEQSKIQVSTGEEQKIEWLRFFASGKKFLIADEPFAHLDQHCTLIIWQYLQQRQYTALISTHTDVPTEVETFNLK